MSSFDKVEKANIAAAARFTVAKGGKPSM